MGACRLLGAFSRRKRSGGDQTEGSKLSRCLTVLDLTALGVGGTLGLGVYVLAGAVAKSNAGPAVCLSFLVAGVASAFAGLCYAEFASRVPKAGSAYVYSYVSVGELVAFVIGWNLILEYVIGTASVARGLSGYIDALVDNSIRRTLTDLLPINVSFLSPYPDLLSCAMILLLTTLLSVGVKESSSVNNVFTGLNLITIAVVLVAGSIKADPSNWNIPKESIPANVTSSAGEGGFLPFGFAGVMAGAAKCFYGFVGFDCVATTGEEAKNPQKSIPLSIVLSLIIVFLAYFGISTVLTMMWPYYDQNPDAPFPYVFEQIGWTAIKWLVTVGAVFALCTSLLGAMFPLPRILYAMANDGLLFSFLATVHQRTKTPLRATVVSGLLAGIMAALFDLQQLIDMMSIGTLLAYTIVAVCVLVLRYQETTADVVTTYSVSSMISATAGTKQQQTLDSRRRWTPMEALKVAFNLNNNKQPSALTSAVCCWAIVAFSVLAIVFDAIVVYCGHKLVELDVTYLVPFLIIALLMVNLLFIIARQPVAEIQLAFKVPMVPLVPALSVIINLYLMLELDYQTWIRFALWLLIGCAIYFLYGIEHSEEGRLLTLEQSPSSQEQKLPSDQVRQTTKL